MSIVGVTGGLISALPVLAGGKALMDDHDFGPVKTAGYAGVFKRFFTDLAPKIKETFSEILNIGLTGLLSGDPELFKTKIQIFVSKHEKTLKNPILDLIALTKPILKIAFIGMLSFVSTLGLSILLLGGSVPLTLIAALAILPVSVFFLLRPLGKAKMLQFLKQTKMSLYGQAPGQLGSVLTSTLGYSNSQNSEKFTTGIMKKPIEEIYKEWDLDPTSYILHNIRGLQKNLNPQNLGFF